LSIPADAFLVPRNARYFSCLYLVGACSVMYLFLVTCYTFMYHRHRPVCTLFDSIILSFICSLLTNDYITKVLAAHVLSVLLLGWLITNEL
jgi:hypothetical protein